MKPPEGTLRACLEPRGSPAPDPDFNAFLHIGADGRVTLLVGKIEMGQGVITSLPQLAAEELNVPLDMVDCVMGDTDLCPFDMGTFGSLSVRLGPVLRAAAAEARAVLVQMAAEKLGVPVAELTVKDGVVISRTDRSKRVSYGELAGGKRIERRLEGKAALEKVAEFTIVGKSAPRRDALDKVTGKAKYAGDIAPSGALHARILRPPSHGAALTSVDTQRRREGAGRARGAGRRPGGRAARASRRGGQGAQAREGDVHAVAVDARQREHLRAPRAGRARGALRRVTAAAWPTGKSRRRRSSKQTYLKGYVAHAAMETHSAVAAVENGKVTVWAGTQTPFPLKTQIARALNLAPEKVRVITPYVGGGFGGKSASAQAIEAARLAVAAGEPVRVIWDRSEEFFFDTFDPAAVFKIRAGLDAAKKIVSWNYEVIGAGEPRRGIVL